MTYVKQKFKKGQVLTAEHLNYMEDGIAAHDLKLANMVSTVDMVTDIDESSDNTHFPSAKAVWTALQGVSADLDDAKLSEAIDTALAQAKASGEFDGPQGEKGDTGADGYTPVKGIDYYTEADKTEMINAVLTKLPTWTGGSY